MATDTEYGTLDLAQMASLVSHEVRNPLAIIGNSIYFIKSKVEASPPVDAKMAKHIGIIESEVQNANAILKDVSAFFKLKEAAPQDTELDPFVEKLLSGRTLPEKVAVKKSLQSRARVAAEQDLLRRALEKLLDNAAEAMPEGGTITVTTRTEKGKAVIEVADTGPGFSPEALAKAFWPFATTKPRRLGLGLATARRIMTLHRGGAELKKAAGGACVRLTLPAA